MMPMTIIHNNMISNKNKNKKPFALCPLSFANHYFSVAKATLELQMSSVRLSVRPSVTETPQPLRIAPIGHQAYRPSSLSTIKPINLWSSFATFKPFGLFEGIPN